MSQRKHLPSIHVPHHKNTAAFETVTMPVPDEVSISMSQNIGAPCQPLVEKGDYVKVGQRIGDVQAFVSAPIFSSVSGTVKSIDKVVAPFSVVTDVGGAVMFGSVSASSPVGDRYTRH